MLKNRHIGKFQIDRNTIDNNPSKALDILSGVLIVDARIEPSADIIQYTGIYYQFRGVAFGEVAPDYLVTFSDNCRKFVEI